MEKIPTNEKFREAERRFKENGPLGVTAEDHTVIGSTPPDILRENPGKTRIELMDDNEVRQWFTNLVKAIKELSDPGFKNKFEEKPARKRILHGLRKNLQVSTAYLQKIRRLPKDFDPLFNDVQ